MQVSRRIGWALVAVCVATYVLRELVEQTCIQTIGVLPDSIVFLQTAAQSFRIDHLFFPKPVVVPAIYRLFDGDLVAIAHGQQALSLVAWLLLGLAVCATVQRRRTRLAAIIITVGFVLAPYRVGWTTVMLSESINDSLLALTVATALFLVLAWRRGRPWLVWGMGSLFAVSCIAWVLTRDTNAITALVAAVVALVLARVDRGIRRRRAVVVLCGLAIAASAFSIWSMGHRPRQPTGLTLDATWQPAALPRGTFPMIYVLVFRILPRHRATAFFADHGMPRPADLWQAGHEGRLVTDPKYAPLLTWLDEHGRSVYAAWLLRHPFEIGDELARHVWDILSAADIRGYMPVGWMPVPRSGLAGLLHETTTNRMLLLLLVVLAPYALRRAWGSDLSRVAFVLLASGLVGAVAACVGDAYELSRHCYGSGQQLVLGLWLAGCCFVEPSARIG